MEEWSVSSQKTNGMQEAPQRKIGGASTFCRCLSLKAGFIALCVFGISYGLVLAAISYPLWKLLGTAEWILDGCDLLLGTKQFDASLMHYQRSTGKEGQMSSPQTLVDFAQELAHDLQKWSWWAIWLAGLLWLLMGVAGFWGICGCCLGQRMNRIRRQSLLLGSCIFLLVEWLVGLSILIGFPIFLRTKWGFSFLTSIWSIIFYTLFIVMPTFIGGFWLFDASFSMYKVYLVGGTGREKKNYAEVAAALKLRNEEREPLLSSHSSVFVDSDASEPYLDVHHKGPEQEPRNILVPDSSAQPRPSVTAVGVIKDTTNHTHKLR